MPSSFWLGILFFGSITLAAFIWRTILLHRLKPPAPPRLKWRHPEQYDEPTLAAVETIFGATLPKVLRNFYLHDAARLAARTRRRSIHLRESIILIANTELRVDFNEVLPLTTHNANVSAQRHGQGTLVLATAGDGFAFSIILRNDGTLWFSEWFDQLEPLPPQYTLETLLELIKTHAHSV